jgi:hypothetical protein
MLQGIVGVEIKIPDGIVEVEEKMAIFFHEIIKGESKVFGFEPQ